jgi:hypothetical protein
LTEIDAICNGADTFFPEFNKDEWTKTFLEEHNAKDINFKMYLYERKII